MEGIIVVGDPTTGGGVVITGDVNWQIDGRPVARVGDQATCKRKGHPGVVTIVQGHPYIQSDDRAVALHGAALSCGCRVLSAKNPNFAGWENEGRDAAHVVAARPDTSSPIAHREPEAIRALLEEVTWIEFRLQDSDGRPQAGEPYVLTLPDGTERSGRLDAAGIVREANTVRGLASISFPALTGQVSRVALDG